MPLGPEISTLTVVISAGVSVVTGYVGTLLNFRRQRDRARRTYGLAILSEIKSLQRVFRQYHGVLGGEPAELRVARLPVLPLTSSDMNVFGFNSGNIGLFSIRTAVEVIDFYSRCRALIAEAQRLAEQAAKPDIDEAALRQALFEHLRAVVAVRAHSRTVAKLLRLELPVMLDERIRALRRRSRIVRQKRLVRQHITQMRALRDPATITELVSQTSLISAD